MTKIESRYGAAEPTLPARAFYLFVRVLPMIAIFEMRMLLPGAATKHGAAGDIGVDVEEE